MVKECDGENTEIKRQDDTEATIPAKLTLTLPLQSCVTVGPALPCWYALLPQPANPLVLTREIKMVLFVLSQGFLSLALWPSFFDLSLLCKISKTGEPPPHPLISSQLRPIDYPRTGCTAVKNIFCSDCPQVISVQPKASAIRNCCTDLSRPRTCQWRMPFVTPSAVQQEIFVKISSSELQRSRVVLRKRLSTALSERTDTTWCEGCCAAQRVMERHGAKWCTCGAYIVNTQAYTVNQP